MLSISQSPIFASFTSIADAGVISVSELRDVIEDDTLKVLSGKRPDSLRPCGQVMSLQDW